MFKDENFEFVDGSWKVKTKTFDGSLINFVVYVLSFDVLRATRHTKDAVEFAGSCWDYDTFTDKKGNIHKIPAFSRSFANIWIDKLQSKVYCSYKDEREAKRKVQEFSQHVFGNPYEFMR